MKKLIIVTLLLCAALLASSCALLDVASSAGLVTKQQAQAIDSSIKVGGAAVNAFKDFTPENEYYIGRTVAANLLTTYKAYDNPVANRYVNELGQTLGALSDKPETFAGYHFLIMDTDEVNAFATPGGLILLSRGLIRCCKTEDALAAVLAHEVGHIQLGHAMSQIKKSRWTDLVKMGATEGLKNMGGGQYAQAADILDGSVGDIVTGMAKKGYAKSMEYEADKAGVTILARAGYNGLALKEMLIEAGRKAPEGSSGFGKTHPTTKERISEIQPMLNGLPPLSEQAERQARFAAATRGV